MNLIWAIPAKGSEALDLFPSAALSSWGAAFLLAVSQWFSNARRYSGIGAKIYGQLSRLKPLRLIINGQEREIKAVKTLAELVRELDISVPHFAVAVNSLVIPKLNHESTGIQDGDKVEIVHAVGGGL